MPFQQRNSGKIGFVVNYYWSPRHPDSVRATAHLALLKLRENSGISSIVLVDGSAVQDQAMREICSQLGIAYHHAGHELSFAQGYNLGRRLLSEPWVGLMASDVLPPPDTVQNMLMWTGDTDIGCLLPYLSFSDYPPQVYGYVWKPCTHEPSAMTLNFNLLRRDVLEQVGGLDESYSGGYNDIILMLRIRQLGFRVVVVENTNVTHLGRVTISHGSTFNPKEDVARFSREYSRFTAKHGKWKIAHWKRPLATTARAAICWWASQNAPSSTARSLLQELTMRMEPLLTTYPARWGKG